MRIIWQVEGGTEAVREDFRRVPRKNVVRLLEGCTWQGVCTIKDGKVKSIDKAGVLRVLSGPNNYLPRELDENESGILVINILRDEPVIKKEESYKVLNKMKGINTVEGSRIEDKVRNIAKMVSKSEENTVLDLVYIPKETIGEIYNAFGNRKNLQSVLSVLYNSDRNGADNDGIKEEKKKMYQAISGVKSLLCSNGKGGE